MHESAYAIAPFRSQLKRISSCPADSDMRQEANAAAAQSYVDALSNELGRKAALFEDDAAFVVEVREGRSPAPGMDPTNELRTLKARFAVFKRDFKVFSIPTSIPNSNLYS